MQKNILSLGLLVLMVFGLNAIPIQADFILCPGGGNCDGTDFADIINGTPDFDEVDGMEGDDFVFLGGGNDEGDGGEGNDFIFGGPGSDDIDGEEGNDHLSAGPDVEGVSQGVQGNEGNDHFYVLVSETTECLIIDPEGTDEADTGNDAAHLLGFGPYIAINPFGQPGFVEGFVHVVDPITGGDILIFVIEGTDEGVEVINGLLSPNVVILATDDQLVMDCLGNLPDND